MGIGGVERAFLNIISQPRFAGAEIHLGLLRREGKFLNYLPKDIVIHECCKGLWEELNRPMYSVILNKIKKKQLLYFFNYLFLYIYSKIINNRKLVLDFLLKNEKEIEICFDEAYAFAGPSSIIDYYINNKVKAKTKHGYVHFDVSKFYVDSKLIRNLYVNYDMIHVVSNEAKTVFEKRFPEFKEKMVLTYTPVNRDFVVQKGCSGESFSDKINLECKRLLTVGRISHEKGQDIAIETLKILMESGLDVKWYLIGAGPLLDEYRKKVISGGLSNHIIFLGAKENPYPYMKDCDIYVQPSRHEGFCLSLAEALCFHKPVVTTDFSGAREQLNGLKNYIITEPDPRNLAQGIIKMLGHL